MPRPWRATPVVDPGKEKDAQPVATGDGREFAPGLAAAVKPVAEDDPDRAEPGDRVAPQTGPDVPGESKKAKGKPKASPQKSNTEGKVETDTERAQRVRREHDNALARARMRRHRARLRREKITGERDDRRHDDDDDDEGERPRRRKKEGDTFLGVNALIIGATVLVVAAWVFRRQLLAAFGYEIVNEAVPSSAPALPTLNRPSGV